MPRQRHASIRQLVTITLSAGTLLLTTPTHATWSIVAFDDVTQEVAVGSATCISSSQVPGIDLVEELPVIVVGSGGGAAQSLLDASAQRRQIIDNGIRNQLSADAIRDQLVLLSNTGLHQHGIAGAGPTQATHTGANNFRHASGTADADDSLHYAIQGNVLTGANVVLAAEQAFRDTTGDLPQRLMAAMEAARDFGGDGRCSCPAGPDADSCGSPPPSFTKSAHVGFMIVARFGDGDDPNCDAGGCAGGDYYLTLNVADQPASAPDPVDQLRTQFDQFLNNHSGRPDAIQSTLAISEVSGGAELFLTLHDWQGIALDSGVAGVTVAHTADSAMNTTIQSVIDNNDGTYTIQLSGPLERQGDDRFLITIDDGIRDVVIPPQRATLPGSDRILADGFEA